MSYLIRSFLLIAALTISLPPCFSQENRTVPTPGGPAPSPAAIETDPNAWKEYSSSQGRFTIMFPGMPIDRDDSFETKLGRFDSRSYRLRTSAEYMVVYTDFALNLEEDTQELDKILDGIRDSAVGDSKARILSETKISLDGHPGRMMKALEANGNIARIKTYAVGNRLYQVTITTPAKEILDPDESRFNESRAAKFLDSFKLIKPESKKNSGSSRPQNPPLPAIEYNANAWKEYVSPQGRFSIMFPGTPTEKDISSITATGRRIDNHEVSLITTAVYRVYYMDYPWDIEKESGLRKQILDAAQAGIVEKTKVKVLSDDDISLNGHPCRMTKFATPTGGIMRDKTCAVGKRMYQVMVATPKETLAPDGGSFDEMRARKFLDSFRLAKPESGPEVKQ